MFLIEVVGTTGFINLRNSISHQQATGFSCDDFRGRTPQELVSEELGNIVAADYTRCVQQAVSICYEETLELPAGKRTWQTTMTPVFQDSQVGYVVGSSRDITERKQAEQALEYERTFLSTVLDSIQEAIVICDHEGRIVRFNEAVQELKSYAGIQFDRGLVDEFLKILAKNSANSRE